MHHTRSTSSRSRPRPPRPRREPCRPRRPRGSGHPPASNRARCPRRPRWPRASPRREHARSLQPAVPRSPSRSRSPRCGVVPDSGVVTWSHVPERPPRRTVSAASRTSPGNTRSTTACSPSRSTRGSPRSSRAPREHVSGDAPEGLHEQLGHGGQGAPFPGRAQGSTARAPWPGRRHAVRSVLGREPGSTRAGAALDGARTDSGSPARAGPGRPPPRGLARAGPSGPPRASHHSWSRRPRARSGSRPMPPAGAPRHGTATGPTPWATARAPRRLA